MPSSPRHICNMDLFWAFFLFLADKGNGQCSPGDENSRMLADVSAANGQTGPQGPNSPSELKIKLEEDTTEQHDNRSPAPEEMGQTGEEEAGLEDSMSSSPRDVHDRLSGPHVVAEAGNRHPNGVSK
ncbi:unnamed protein product [Tetraodon nigroviridis]|uniref:(spotted green pufferfish) hypothetical protein n=1 Tax=Tetraodon nigroviridis TaxID=99883 RepID=Q4RQS9_TETNG|nr:unnamed protein product [Tetraodon nigroviridis]